MAKNEIRLGKYRWSSRDSDLKVYTTLISVISRQKYFSIDESADKRFLLFLPLALRVSHFLTKVVRDKRQQGFRCYVSFSSLREREGDEARTKKKEARCLIHSDIQRILQHKIDTGCRSFSARDISSLEFIPLSVMIIQQPQFPSWDMEIIFWNHFLPAPTELRTVFPH